MKKTATTIEIPFGNEGVSVLCHLRNLVVHPLGEGVPHNDLSLSETTGIPISRLRKILDVMKTRGLVRIEKDGRYRWFIWLEGQGLWACEKMMATV